ncbi:hypothetical protein P3X46_029259 [Hevea brasiliensis]|uniref:mannan endo-1,4-beta-mannosidase n=1 Tax=Hevea brasiliensis TaxID=3981 RepID=A0ABQ9KRL2_HEVBR|nr:hypothetical protein P3X46_029259 [Hevea brasiliensis]
MVVTSLCSKYSPGSYNEQMFKGLDFVIAEARRYGIKLTLSLANNYDSFGGKKQYVNWARNQGQYLSSDDDFFRHPGLDLMKEPRCTSDPSGLAIQAIQNLNPGIEIGTDFIANNRIPGIDFATVHLYPDQCTYQRDLMFNTVYYKIYSPAKRGGATSGGLFWQLITERMDNFRDGYEIILTERSSTVECYCSTVTQALPNSQDFQENEKCVEVEEGNSHQEAAGWKQGQAYWKLKI